MMFIPKDAKLRSVYRLYIKREELGNAAPFQQLLPWKKKGVKLMRILNLLKGYFCLCCCPIEVAKLCFRF
jgi:hypothetical protein